MFGKIVLEHRMDVVRFKFDVLVIWKCFNELEYSSYEAICLVRGIPFFDPLRKCCWDCLPNQIRK